MSQKPDLEIFRDATGSTKPRLIPNLVAVYNRRDGVEAIDCCDRREKTNQIHRKDNYEKIERLPEM
jgi:hypothetical protein